MLGDKLAAALATKDPDIGGKHRQWIWTIIISSGAMIVALWVLTYERTAYEQDLAVERIIRHNSNLAIALEEHTLRTFSSASQALAQVGRQHRTERHRINVVRMVKEGAIDHSFLSVIGVADAKGVVLHDSLDSKLRSNFANHDFFKAHVESDKGHIHIGKPLLGPLSGKWAIPISRRINNPDGSFGGIVFAGIRPDYFIEFYRKGTIGRDGLVQLLGLDGISRARLVGDQASFGVNGSKSSLFKEQAKAPVGHLVTRGVREGIPRFQSYRTLTEYPLIVGVGTSQREALAEVGERKQLYFAMSSIGTALIGIFAGVLLFGVAKQRRVEEQQRLSTKVIESIADGVIITDSNKRIVSVNQAFTHLTGYTSAEVLGQPPAILQSGRQDRNFYQGMWRQIDATGHWQGEIWDRRKSGEIFPELLSISAVHNSEGEISNYVGVFNDISAFKNIEERLEHQAQYDALTDLPNRLLMTDRLSVALSQAQRSGKHIALLFLDLDRFKNVNDSFGHSLGDALLREAAGRLKACLRSADTISRQGGDEFLVILPEIDSDQDAARVAEKLIAAISRPFAFDGTEIVLTGSVGIACFPENGEDPQTLVLNADAAMYSAKNAGRNCYQFYTADLNRRAQDRLLLESELRHAIDREELFLVYQPQVDLGTGAVVGLEALVRWKHPKRGVVSPAEFIGVAEESGLIAPIGRWVLKAACHQHAKWLADGMVRGTIAVNVSAYQFRQADFLRIITDALSRSGLQAGDLEVEVTESAMMQDIEDVLFKLNSLNKLGVKIAIDDFGTGYSSLSYLKQFPIYRLKVDQSFTRGLPEDRESSAIARAIISMGHSLGLNVLAEGVETTAQEEHLRSLWCNVGQGYLYAKPFPAKECTEYLRLHPVLTEGVWQNSGA